MIPNEQTIIRNTIRKRLTSGYSYGPNSLVQAIPQMLSSYRLKRQWDRLETAGLVTLQIIPDDCYDYDILFGDIFDVDLNKDTVPGGERTIIAQRKAEERRIEREGVWGLVGFYRLDPVGYSDPNYCSITEANAAGWYDTDSLWGFIGNDGIGSGYDTDIQAETIRVLRDALGKRKRPNGICKACGQPMHRLASRGETL